MTPLLLEWREEHRIGIDALDFEHQDLFRRINQLLDDFARHEERMEIEACLGEIHARMAAHFALEEKFMRDKGYAHYAEHRAEHDRFLDDFVVAMAEFENDPGACESEALERDLKRWILDHVLTADKRMSAMTRCRGAGHDHSRHEARLPMALIIWSGDYSVGVDVLDADHIIVASLINHIDDAKLSGSDESAVGRVIKVLVDHAYAHFAREEALLEKHAYPHLERHRQEHRLLEDQLGELYEEYTRTPDPEISREIMELLNFWLVEHILQVDMHYKQFLQRAMA